MSIQIWTQKGSHLDHLLGDYENEKSYLGLMIVYPEQLKGVLKYLKQLFFWDISVNS